MCSTSLIPIWFVCKPCSLNFQNLNDFIEHKNEEHLQELLRNKCIVFEERTLDGVAIAESGVAEPNQGYDATHLMTVKEEIENATNADLHIDSNGSEQIPNSQLIINSESQINFNDPNDDPATVSNILRLNSNSHFELLQGSDLKQNPNDNFCEDVKPNPEDLINTSSEIKYEAYEIENGETQSENTRKKPSQLPSVYLNRLSEQEIKNVSSVVVTGNPNKYRRPRKMCSVCLKSFADQGRLNGHFERFHKLPLPFPNKSPLPKHFACKVCGKRYNALQNLRRHFRAVHKNEVENKTNSNLCIKSIRSKQIPNSQLIINSESQINFNDPNEEPAAVNNILGLNSNSHFELFQDSNLNQNPNDNFSEDVKPNQEDLINTSLEIKYEAYEMENGETQSENIRKNLTQNPGVSPERLTQQEIQKASPVLVKGNPKKYRRLRKVCSICPKSFADRRSLRGHFERVHKLPFPLPKKSLVSKQFACKVCGKKYSAPSDLRRHCRAMHETEGLDLEYQRQPAKFKSNAKVCTICHNSYAGISSLKRHIQLKHGNNNKNDDELGNVTIKRQVE